MKLISQHVGAIVDGKLHDSNFSRLDWSFTRATDGRTGDSRSLHICFHAQKKHNQQIS